MPAFLQSDDEEADGYGEGLLSGVNTRRRRRQYDEQMDQDDVEEDVSGSTVCRIDPG
jgi:DNA replication licensing factor MCM2